jgi:AraC-like DNA-binding protein
MYSNLAFSITLLGIFSIFENIKTNQKFSLLKYYILALLILLTSINFMDYLYFTSYSIPYYKEITRVFTAVLTINLFFLIVIKKIPRFILIIEGILIFFFIIEFINRFQFPLLQNGVFQYELLIYHKIFYAFCLLFILGSLAYITIKLFERKDIQNIYELKIRKWVGIFFLVIFILLIYHITFIFLFLNGEITTYDTYFNIFIFRLCFLLFILFRPKFLDDDKYSRPFNEILAIKPGVNFQNFEFLFYSNHYYLRHDATMEDLALKLNTSKTDLSDFLKNEIEENFTELLNKNRVEYLKELLKAKKYESFTIEALSEMAGFNNRRTMYNAFNKHIGMTPTEFIQSFK